MAAAAAKLWVKIEDDEGVDKVSTASCDDVADFKVAIQQKFPRALGRLDCADFFIFDGVIRLNEESVMTSVTGGQSRTTALVVKLNPAGSSRTCVTSVDRFIRSDVCALF